jgi:hypothetical protein
LSAAPRCATITIKQSCELVARGQRAACERFAAREGFGVHTSEDVKTQLRLLGDLRDVFEKYLALSRKSADAAQAAEEDYVRHIAGLLVTIQTRRNELLVHQMAAAGQAIGAEMEGSRVILESSVDLLKRISALYPPLYSPFEDFMANVEAYFAPRPRG